MDMGKRRKGTEKNGNNNIIAYAFFKSDNIRLRLERAKGLAIHAKNLCAFKFRKMGLV